MFWIFLTNHSHHITLAASPVYNFTIRTDLFYRRSYFHFLVSLSIHYAITIDPDFTLFSSTKASSSIEIL